MGIRMDNVPRNGYQIEILRFDDCSLICVNDRSQSSTRRKAEEGKKTNKERDNSILVFGSG